MTPSHFKATAENVPKLLDELGVDESDCARVAAGVAIFLKHIIDHWDEFAKEAETLPFQGDL